MKPRTHFRQPRRFSKARISRCTDFRVLFFPLAILTATSCAVFTTRPIQEMSNTSSAIRAAKEVQADTLAPELYRQSREWFFKAQQEYKLKNFKNAKEYANTARRFAEEAELEALKNNGVRNSEAQIVDPLSDAANAPGGNMPTQAPPPPPVQRPYDYPAPAPTPYDQYEQRKREEDAARKEFEQQLRNNKNPGNDVNSPPQVIGTPNPNDPGSAYRLPQQ